METAAGFVAGIFFGTVITVSLWCAADQSLAEEFGAVVAE